MSSDPVTLAAVEIGSSKVAAIVAEYTGYGFTIKGWGECQSQGVRKGCVIDYPAVTQCTQQALENAKRATGGSSGVPVEQIDKVFLAQTGGHLDGFYNEGARIVSAADNMVSAEDIAEVRRLAKAKELPEGRMLLERLRHPFRLDGRLIKSSPEHLCGRRLEVGYWMVHGDESRISDSYHMISNSQIEVAEMVLSGLASGRVVTSQAEREHGVLVIDIGGGTSDYALYRDGLPYVAGAVAVGGGHLSNDLTIGLRLSTGQGDRVKLRHGRAIVQCRDKAQKVWLDGDLAIGDRQLPLLSIEKILEARVREIFEVVKHKLGTAFSPETCAAGVVLTGGTSKLPAIAEAAAAVFNTPVHIGQVSDGFPEPLQDPGFHTALGLLQLGIEKQRAREAAERSQRPGFLRRLFARPSRH
ncbi:cell division protein FtsA [Cephaloticoccus primus]|uniref:Cell division protein FtsA n=1 Tax=Cephaloticoccus primus TaxID=1548207 RepID=A0A139SLN8_9BACT|nr:cell division protein FtsA [Cephaloticoccus primus]KXU35473.1 cell division protein FtsA [Cephaloticoccus primus]